MTELQELMRQNVAAPPPDDLDVAGLVADGRARVRGRRRQRVAVGAAACAVVGLVAVSAIVMPRGGDHAGPAGRPPAPDAPTLSLADARPAVAGRDYTELASYTNENLDRDNGQYFDGVTEDGLILFRDGPRSDQLWPRFALMDPATGEKDWLPKLSIGQAQSWPLELGRDRLVLVGTQDDRGDGGTLVAYVFDRGSREWSTMTWPDLKVDYPRAVLGPDDRLYIGVPATQGRVPEGGWPTDSSGEADDADAEGDTYHLWSVSLTDSTDVRDEGLTVGGVAFTEDSMVYTDSTNGAAGLVHVRDLTSGSEHTFDPHAGDRCNLLSFGAHGDRIVMGEYCGTYDGGVRDDRVQVLSTDGDQVVTLQDNGLDGGLPAGSDVVTVTAYGSTRDDPRSGTYVYDLATDRFLQISTGSSKFGVGGATGNPGEFRWNTPVNKRHGATQSIGVLRR
ncbi:MAG TPA: hypothetical protein VFT70_16385 [Nocardioides sp.]|nr:hypothetical protein [Nocardioides sp.]